MRRNNFPQVTMKATCHTRQWNFKVKAFLKMASGPVWLAMFFYTLACGDAFGQTNKVSNTVKSLMPPLIKTPRLLLRTNIVTLPVTNFIATFSGGGRIPDATMVELQTSTDFVNWVKADPYPFTYTVSYCIPINPAEPQRFYRTVTEESQ